MGAPYKTIWTREAFKDLQSILRYLADRWSSREVDRFLEQLHEREKMLSQQPKAFPLSEMGGNYRRSVLTNQITIYYKFENDTVEISSVFDTLQNPDNLNLTQEEIKTYQAG